MQIGTEAPRPSGLQLLEDEDFVWSRVWPLVSRRGASRPQSGFDVVIHRNRADGRYVAAYGFEGSVRAFAKLYPDGDLGRAVYRNHDGLCANGFGAGSGHRVPAPIAYLDEHGILLLEPAVGERLGELPLSDWRAFEDGVARAARWLAALHASPLELGPREDVGDGALRLARRMEKAIALRPDLEELLTTAVDVLTSRHGTRTDPSGPVQTHGRYHCAHVFVAPGCTTAVDLDRAAVADPAKDVGEFVAALSSIRRLRLVDDGAIDAACELFVDEYSRHARRTPHELSYYWSYCIVWALVRQAFKDRPERRRWRERLDFLGAELAAVPSRTAAWLNEPRPP
jgi:hypothetical protein